MKIEIKFVPSSVKVEGGIVLDVEARISGTEHFRRGVTGDQAIGRLVSDFARLFDIQLEFKDPREYEPSPLSGA